MMYIDLAGHVHPCTSTVLIVWLSISGDLITGEFSVANLLFCTYANMFL